MQALAFRITKDAVASFGAGLVYAFCSSWFAGAYTHLSATSLAEVRGNSADLASYLVPPENTRLGQWVAGHTALTPRWIWGEQTLYVGMVTLALGVVGLWERLRRPERLTAAVIVAGGIALALSFGPGLSGQMPFDYFATLPAVGLLRSPARLALLVMFALSVLVAAGAVFLRTRWRRPATVLLTMAAALGLWESYVVGFPGGTPPREPIPAVYERLASLPAGPVLSLPTYRFAPDNFREADYVLFSTAHWLPIVNGFGRHEPPSHKEQMEILSRFPEPAAIARLRQIGVRYVVLHPARASELARAATEAGQVPGVRLVAREGDDVLFEIGPDR